MNQPTNQNPINQRAHPEQEVMTELRERVIKSTAPPPHSTRYPLFLRRAFPALERLLKAVAPQRKDDQRPTTASGACPPTVVVASLTTTRPLTHGRHPSIHDRVARAHAHRHATLDILERTNPQRPLRPFRGRMADMALDAVQHDDEENAVLGTSRCWPTCTGRTAGGSR